MVRDDLARPVPAIVAAGQHLAQAKVALGYGAWLPWIERELPIVPRTVEIYIRIGAHPTLADPIHGSILPTSRNALWELARMDGSPVPAVTPLLNQAIADGRVTPDMERKHALALVAEYRARCRPRPPAGSAVASVGLVSTIIADPPWRYDNTATRAAAEDHYPTMSIAELCALPVARERSAPESHLYLWVTSAHLPEAFSVMAAWGFDYKTYLVWVKPYFGLGNYFRTATELVLFGVKGGLGTNARDLNNWFEAARERHSKKPAEFRKLVMRASPGPYLELFSRCSKPGECTCSACEDGWETWGNES
jgi:N6-adenosine-specific RNA methylase IME4